MSSLAVQEDTYKMTFKTEVKTRFYDGDVAAIAFHGVIFRLAHDCFEEFLNELGIAWHEWFRDEQHAAPIRKAEAEYFKPLLPGKTYQVELSVEKLGKSSIHLKHVFLNEQAQICAIVRKTHVFVNRQKLKPQNLPDELREKLAHYQSS